jgi:glyoxylase-like metal-dependent hydrolase (beta-lactamase superfamily II)
MRRSLSLGILTLTGVLLTAATYEARQERAALEVQTITDNLYMLANASSVQGMGGGGNTAIWVMANGVALVDTKINGYGQDIIDHVAGITDKPITTVINTHTHFDHSGGNTELPDTVNFVVHENTRAQMARDTCEPVTNCDAFKGDNAKYLPQTTYSDRMSLFAGADQIDLYHFGRGHTDGDTFVVFTEARTLHTGDMFQRKGLPFIDVANGNGSATEFGATLRKAVAGIANVDTVIPGHNPTPVAWAEFVDFSAFYNDVVSKAQNGKAAGRSVDDVVAAYRVPDEYSDFAAPEQSLRTTVQYVFDGQ